MYGKKNAKSNLYFHELCAIWMPQIHMSDENEVKNLMKEVDRCRMLTCSFCLEKGAGLGCKVVSCKNQYHFLCAKSVTGADE